MSRAAYSDSGTWQGQGVGPLTRVTPAVDVPRLPGAAGHCRPHGHADAHVHRDGDPASDRDRRPITDRDRDAASYYHGHRDSAPDGDSHPNPSSHGDDDTATADEYARPVVDAYYNRDAQPIGDIHGDGASPAILDADRHAYWSGADRHDCPALANLHGNGDEQPHDEFHGHRYRDDIPFAQQHCDRLADEHHHGDGDEQSDRDNHIRLHHDTTGHDHNRHRTHD